MLYQKSAYLQEKTLCGPDYWLDQLLTLPREGWLACIRSISISLEYSSG